MESDLRIRIESFRAKCLQIGIELHEVAFVAPKEEILDLLTHRYGIGIKPEHFDEITVNGVRVIKKI